MCDTVAEAQSYVDSIVNSAEVINLGFDHSIGYGLDTVEVKKIKLDIKNHFLK